MLEPPPPPPCQTIPGLQRGERGPGPCSRAASMRTVAAAFGVGEAVAVAPAVAVGVGVAVSVGAGVTVLDGVEVGFG